MLRTLGVALATTTMALAGWAGTVTGNPAPPALSATPTPGPTLTCPPALPISGQFSGATVTSLTITYSMILTPPCGYDPPITVTLFTGREDAAGWQDPVASAVSGPQRQGTVTVGGLTPDTAYWFRFSAGETRDPYVVGGPGRTLSAAPVVCRATATIDSRWSGGFVATVTVRNTAQEPLDGWEVTWRWSGDERIQSIWGGVVSGTGVDVTVRNASWNGTLAPGGVTTFGMLVSASVTPDGLTPTCGP
ncbi:cellulose binding domain-containing protein [Micromonospora sp. NPDC051925]|uniref:cellulose binding domain-containing protein n=1 Tax=Micromonospora sp. NPDC051925 TaxID=3364288 RepID=UPI0037C5A77A